MYYQFLSIIFQIILLKSYNKINEEIQAFIYKVRQKKNKFRLIQFLLYYNDNYCSYGIDSFLIITNRVKNPCHVRNHKFITYIVTKCTNFRVIDFSKPQRPEGFTRKPASGLRSHGLPKSTTLNNLQYNLCILYLYGNIFVLCDGHFHVTEVFLNSTHLRLKSLRTPEQPIPGNSGTETSLN